MERIKLAIEKAKKNPGAHKSVRPVANATSVAATSPTADEIGDLDYKDTQVVALDAAHLEKNRIVALNKNAPMSWVFDLLRTQVLQKMDENGWRTLAITSPTPEAGKTVVSINLAMSIAHQTNRTAMLVDFDLRRPKVGNYLGLPMKNSLNEFFEGTAGLSDALVNPGIPRLVVLPASKPVAKSAEMLSSKKTEGLINEFRNRYEDRIVIFDLPPLLNADDAIAILPKIDCVLMVVANGGSSKSEIEESMHHLAHSNLLGVILNKAEAMPRSYYY